MSRQHIFGITSPGGFRCALIDFTNAGGRAPRDFIYELGGDSFMGIYIAPGDDIYPPTANPVLTMAAVGDSYPARLGVMTSMWAYPQLAGDAHGIRNVINTAIGACGYADGLCASRGVLARISEVTGINGGNGPDVILLSNGTNDMAAGESPAQVAAYQTAYIQALRANGRTRFAPIFVLGIYAHNNGGTSCIGCVAAENGEAAAVTALNDPNVFFCPWTTDPAGAWETGTGTITGQNGSDNTDFTYEASNGRNNPLGNRQFAARIVTYIRNVLNAGRY
jgi:lysophospholipase L1-like esterase